MNAKKAAVLMAHGFEEVEAVTVIDILRRGGIAVSVVSTENTLEVSGAHDIKLVCDMAFDDYYNEEALFDAVVLPGGLKCAESLRNAVKEGGKLAKILSGYNESGKLIAAICAAPIALGAAGLLKGKRAVCYPGFERELLDASYCGGENVVVAGNIVTAKAAGAAALFAFTLIDLLLCDNGVTSSDVKTKMFY